MNPAKRSVRDGKAKSHSVDQVKSVCRHFPVAADQLPDSVSTVCKLPLECRHFALPCEQFVRNIS